MSSADVSTQVIGPSWGEQITNKALTGLAVFLVLIVFYLSITFEWRMAVAALVALFHDVFITVGIYCARRLRGHPRHRDRCADDLGVLALRHRRRVRQGEREHSECPGGSRMTYSEAANLAVNQTLMRSINTSIVGLLPVASLLFVGAYVLGAGTLKDLALALFVGIAVGTYSSIFIATPVLAQLKEREPQMQALVQAGQCASGWRTRGRGVRGGTGGAGEASDAARMAQSSDGVGGASSTGQSRAVEQARETNRSAIASANVDLASNGHVALRSLH